MSDRVIRIDAPTVAAVIDDLRFAVNYHETYGNSRIANAARAAIEALEARERQGDPLDGYHPMVRDFLLGRGCFSQEAQIEAARRVGERIGKAAAEAMNEALLEAFAPALDLAQTPGRKCDNPGDDSISSAGANASAQNGLRTERVTLEITMRAESYAPCRDLDWQRMLRQTPGGLFPGESVRVVEVNEAGA